jgi:hypothetical protein
MPLFEFLNTRSVNLAAKLLRHTCVPRQVR